MTPQYEHASKVADIMRLFGEDAEIVGEEEARLLAVKVGVRVFSIPPYAAYNHDAATTAEKIFEALQ